ncbi:TPA: hypothetical protein M2Q89_004911 [Escherichia coli]|nr:hypothetical protein [Escherichia coli]
MKKTLIALAVAASAAASGSAMAAWTANGTDGSVGMNGTLTPVSAITPWEVKTGDAVTNLDGHIKKGQRTAYIAVNNAIPVLGIRTIESKAFQGQAGISPQIDYGNAVNVDAFENGRVPVTLEVKDASDAKIGTLTTSMGASTLVSYVTPTYSGYNHEYAVSAGQAFFGGLPKNRENTPDTDIASAVFPDIASHFTYQGASRSEVGEASNFTDTGSTYCAFYGSGIEQGETIKITLDQPAGADRIAWKASLPVTVSYQ